MPTIAPFLVPEIRLSAITAEPAPGDTDTAMPTPALRTTLPVTLTSRRYCPQPTEMPAIGAFSMMLPVTAVSASTPMPMPSPSFGSVPAGRFGTRLRIRLPCTTASRPPWLKLVTATPIAAPSIVLLAITAPSKPNSA